MKKPRILITGGTGLLALNWACAVRGKWDVILGTHQHSVDLKGTTSYKLDLEHLDQLALQLDQLSPDLLVHAAGLTNVNHCEECPEMAQHANAEIARNVAQVSAQQNIKLIHISTDHLFAGNRSFCGEDSAPQPINEYARSKHCAEEWVQQVCSQALIVRTNFFGWGHSQRQSFSDRIIYNLRAGKSLSMFDDVFITPILLDKLALFAHELISINSSGIINLVGEERISKYEFALKLVSHFDLPTELVRRSQVACTNFKAPRPNDMSLDNARVRQILGRNMGSVDDYLAELLSQEAQGRRLELFNAVS
jgi:dTDP-4-dehydrorhamnose reductase